MNKTFWKAAAVRAIKTFAQALIAAIGASTMFGQVEWMAALSTAGLAAVLSILTSLAGLPEVKQINNNKEAE